MAPLEPWEKVLVDNEAFVETVHGEITCTECHGGDATAEDKETAHTSGDARPSAGEAPACVDCHEREVALQETSLHANLTGYWTALTERGADPELPAMHEAFGNHCASCHTSCGDCHVSQPTSVGGGLYDGHVFTATPPMTRSCTACHGSRVGNEYMGKNEDVLADVHFRQGRMSCVDCHGVTEMHGDTGEELPQEPLSHRYAGDIGPRCEDCHDIGSSDNDYHKMHGDALSCQVCHSTTYINCDSCHVATTEEGTPFFETAATYFTFLIGRNTLKDSDRPYNYVPVRHVPVDTESFAFYGENMLPAFDARPTWRYATPHNIQRNTPQTESCNHCHGNPEIFLTADKVNPAELDANLPVIVEEIPDER